MTRQHPELPQGYTAKGRWYYRVRAEGNKRVWVKISLVAAGLPAFYQELSRLGAAVTAPDRIPALVADWMTEVMPAHAAKTQENDRWAMGAIAAALAEFKAEDVTTPDCLEFLKDYRDRPRTHNLMRHALMELMRYAEGKANDGKPYRPPNSNPVASIKRMSTPARDRYPTDSEVRRIKFHALVGRDGKPTRSGPMLACLIDLAYLTGQRVGDLLDLRWHKLAALNKAGEVEAPFIAAEGLYFKPSKTEKTTGAKVLITWTPRLKAVIARIEAIDRKHPRYVLTNQEAQPLLYSTFATAWWRACDRAGIKGLHFHDLRAKAITDTEQAQGIKAAQTKGAHSTEQQTRTYTRHKKAQKAEATR